MRPRGLFVAYSDHLGPGKGGVQTCTREFQEVLSAAGIELQLFPVEPDRRWATRVGRKFNPSKYWRPVDSREFYRLQNMISEFDFLFLNQVSLSGIFKSLQMPQPAIKTVMLSHGCEITDLLHLSRLAAKLPLTTHQLGFNADMTLALTLGDECRARSHVDGVICISPYDADTERWLGTRNVTWIPRVVSSEPINRVPVEGRFGYVGTLDHAPNLEGLVMILEQLKSTGAEDIKLRIIGGPVSIGTWLQRYFINAEYLGALDDDALISEAQSWQAFLHPIFCLPRGCSTKLACPISWNMPIITTQDGRRGYSWLKGKLIETKDPTEFVEMMQKFADKEFGNNVEKSIRLVADSSPKLGEIGANVATFLNNIVGRQSR